MIEERRNAVYASIRREHALDTRNYEGQPWVQNIDGTWTKSSRIEKTLMTISEEGVRFHNTDGVNELYGV